MHYSPSTASQAFFCTGQLEKGKREDPKSNTTTLWKKVPSNPRSPRREFFFRRLGVAGRRILLQKKFSGKLIQPSVGLHATGLFFLVFFFFAVPLHFLLTRRNYNEEKAKNFARQDLGLRRNLLGRSQSGRLDLKVFFTSWPRDAAALSVTSCSTHQPPVNRPTPDRTSGPPLDWAACVSVDMTAVFAFWPPRKIKKMSDNFHRANAIVIGSEYWGVPQALLGCKKKTRCNWE